MNTTDDLTQLIRMAQVLKMRTGLLADELGRLSYGPEAGSARRAADDAQSAEKRLIQIADSLNRPGDRSD